MNLDPVKLDCRGMRCPAPILTLTKASRAPERPAKLEILADDGDFPTDIQAWCRSTGAQLTSIDDTDGVFRARVEFPERLAAQAPAPVNREPTTPPSTTPVVRAERVEVSCEGMRCPAPILAVARAAKAATRATVLEVRATDGDFPTDLQAWSRSTGNAVLELSTVGGVHRALVGVQGATLADLEPARPSVSEPVAPQEGLDLRSRTGPVALLTLGQKVMEEGRVVFKLRYSPELERQVRGWATAVDVPLALVRVGDELHGEVGGAALPQLPATEPSAPAREAAPLAGAVSSSEVPRENRTTLLVLRNDFESLMAALMVANASAAQGMKVEIFFSFWGVNVLRGDAPRDLPGTELERTSPLKRMMKWMMPAGPDRQQMSKMNFAGAGVGMMKYFMREQNVLGIRELMQEAVELDVKFVVCTMSMGIMGISKADLMDLPNLEFGGVTAFTSTARVSAAAMVF